MDEQKIRETLADAEAAGSAMDRLGLARDRLDDTITLCRDLLAAREEIERLRQESDAMRKTMRDAWATFGPNLERAAEGSTSGARLVREIRTAALAPSKPEMK